MKGEIVENEMKKYEQMFKLNEESFSLFNEAPLTGVHDLGTFNNALFPRWQRQLRTRILMYYSYTAVLRAMLPCSHGKITLLKAPKYREM